MARFTYVYTLVFCAICYFFGMLIAAQAGHDESSLTEERTLESLYINPILDVLKRQNPMTRFVSSKTKK